jgi:DNA-binding winged helix-turn-helix (wHTH) protein
MRRSAGGAVHCQSPTNLKILKRFGTDRMPTSADGDMIEFGRFRLHRRDRTLLADGQKLDLGVRAIEVLLALIEVTKDALLDRAWSGGIVEENNLHVQICTLRRALGADADLVGTVPRRGYRFTGDVVAATGSASAAHIGPEPTTSSASHLPIPLGELIGREADLSQVVELQTSQRLLTFTGPGRIGKTSLALAAAWRLVDQRRCSIRSMARSCG